MAKNKLKKKKRFISFLIVADDQTEPISLKLGIITLRILAGVAIFWLLFIMFGAIYFVKSLEKDHFIGYNWNSGKIVHINIDLSKTASNKIKIKVEENEELLLERI